VAAVVVVAPVGPVVAQEAGGVLWRFGVSQLLQTESNPSLATPDAPRESTARTNLSLDVSSATVGQELSFSASGALVAGDSTGGDTFQSPRVSFGYSRTAANASLTTTLFAQDRDVDALAFDLGVDALGNAVVLTRPDTGTQRRYGGRVGTSWGDAGPVGLSLSLSQTEIDYTGTNDPDLVDSTRIAFSSTLRLEFSPVTQLNVTASTSRLDEAGVAATSTTDSLRFNLSNARPDGTIGIAFATTRSDDGTRTNLSLSRNYEITQGILSLSAGVENGASGKSGFTGGFNWQQERPSGSFSMALSYGLTQDSRDSEIRRTSLSANVQEQLLPRLSGSLGLSYVASENEQTGVDTIGTSLSAGLSYEMTPDWGLNVNATHRIKDPSNATKADDTIVSLSISRTFEFRP
jgi:hypothetical protein